MFTKILKLNPQSVEGLRGMLSVALRNNLPGEVEKYKRELERIAPDDAETKRLTHG